MGNFFVSEDDAHFLEAIKLSNALELSFYKDEVLYQDIPNREDYESLEDFNKANIQFMVNKVDEIKNIKHTTFVSTLKAYNDILNDVYKIKRCDFEEGRLFNEMIDYSNNDIKRAGMIAFYLSLLFPAIIPITLLVSVPRVGFDLLQKRNCKRELEKIDILKKKILLNQDIFYEYIDTLRTDYHKSNKELDELRRRAINGENIMPKLLEILNPKRIGLDVSFLDLAEDELGEENFKLIKK